MLTSLNLLPAAPRFTRQIRNPARPQTHSSDARLRSTIGVVRCVEEETVKSEPTPPQPDPPKKELPTQQEEQVKLIVESMKARGIDQEKARSILRLWKDAGVTDAESFKKSVAGASIQPLISYLFQTGLDFSAAAFSFLTAQSLNDNAAPFFGQGVLVGLLTVLGLYFALSTLSDITSAVFVGLALRQFGSNSEAMMAAVQQLAGPDTSLLGKASEAVNIVRVVRDLSTVADLLKSQVPATDQLSTLQNLNAYLTIQKAKELYGFKVEDYPSLTAEEVSRVAVLFSQYDLNGDYKLQQDEFKKLLQEVNCEGCAPFDDAYVEEAVRLINEQSASEDLNTIEFDTFVKWWIEDVKLPAPGVASSQDSGDLIAGFTSVDEGL